MGINLKLHAGESRFATISLTTQLLRAACAGETLYAIAELVNQGKNFATMQARLTNEKNKLIGMALGTFNIKETRNGSS